MEPYQIRVYDVRPDGHSSLDTLPRLDEDELGRLQAFYGFEIDYTHGYERAAPGELFWSIAAFELKAGPAILQPQVWGAAGTPITAPPGILLYLSWPGADPFPPGVDPPYEERGVGGFTGDNGTIGWGFGGESHIGEDGGPYTVWASSDPADADYERRVGSDAVRKLGWWDDHIIPNPIFQVKRKGGGLPPGDVTEYLVNVVGGVVTGHIPFISGPPLAGAAALGLMRDGAIVAHMAWE
jgi:hypothetical protein